MGERLDITNRKGLVFHHDNVGPHISLMTWQKLTELNWENLMHHRRAFYCFFLAKISQYQKNSARNHLSQFFAKHTQKFSFRIATLLEICNNYSQSIYLFVVKLNTSHSFQSLRMNGELKFWIKAWIKIFHEKTHQQDWY